MVLPPLQGTNPGHVAAPGVGMATSGMAQPPRQDGAWWALWGRASATAQSGAGLPGCPAVWGQVDQLPLQKPEARRAFLSFVHF